MIRAFKQKNGREPSEVEVNQLLEHLSGDENLHAQLLAVQASSSSASTQTPVAANKGALVIDQTSPNWKKEEQMNSSSSSSSSAAGGGGEGEGEQLSEEDEKMRLLQMIKDSSNGPEQAKRRIELLDKMVQGLKKRRKRVPYRATRTPRHCAPPVFPHIVPSPMTTPFRFLSFEHEISVESNGATSSAPGTCVPLAFRQSLVNQVPSLHDHGISRGTSPY